MSKDLHTSDQIFVTAYHEYEVEPSADVWEKISAGLDGTVQRKAVTGWKIIAALLIILVAGFVLIDTGAGRKVGGQVEGRSGLATDGTDYTEEVGKEIKVMTKGGIVSNQKSFKVESNQLINQKVELLNQFNFPDYNAAAYLKNPAPIRFSNPLELFTAPVATHHINAGLIPSIKYPKDSKWLITVIAAYEAAGYRLDSDDPDDIDDIKDRESPEASFSGGVLVSRILNKNWSIQSGLSYSNTNIGIGEQKIYAFLDPAGDVAYKYVTSSGYAFVKPKTGAPPSFGDSIVAREGQVILNYITVPLTVKFQTGKGRLSFVPGLGIEANFLTDKKVQIELETASNHEMTFTSKLHGAKSFYWSIALDGELRYKLNEKTALSVKPSWHNAISPITENNEVETLPYSFRLGVGLTFKF